MCTCYHKIYFQFLCQRGRSRHSHWLHRQWLHISRQSQKRVVFVSCHSWVFHFCSAQACLQLAQFVCPFSSSGMTTRSGSACVGRLVVALPFATWRSFDTSERIDALYPSLCNCSHGGPTYLYKAGPFDNPIFKQMDKVAEGGYGCSSFGMFLLRIEGYIAVEYTPALHSSSFLFPSPFSV